MSAEEAATENGSTLGGRTAIGIAFGNSNSSIAYTTSEDKAEVIANEDGGMCYCHNLDFKHVQFI